MINKKYILDDVLSRDYAKKCSVRINATLSQIEEYSRPALDVGEKNFVGEILGVDSYTNFDLNDKWSIELKYNTIFCFEVLEHLENPKMLLVQINKHLKESGILYLTTPARWWMGKGEKHFREYSRKELERMLIRSGFEILELKRIRAYNLRHIGIRPIVRWIRDLIFGQCFFIKAIQVAEDKPD